MNKKILLIGAGNMGSALLSAWQCDGVYGLTVVESNQSFTADNVKLLRSVEEVTEAPDCIVLAVKPQSMDELLPSLAKKFGSQSLYLSIAAGKTLGYFQQHLGNVNIMRAMPNTPALIGKGITALCASDTVNEAQKELAISLLAAAGEVVWLQDESLMDVVTAISGSGPAYVFLFMELLIEAGITHGLPQDMAKKLVIETVLGSAELTRKSSESLENLRKNVTSPGGTTQAALSELMRDNALKMLLANAIDHAVKRAKELA